MIEANLEELIPDPRNANKGTERGYGMLNKSLQNLGAGRSIVCDKNNVVIAGNKTLQAAVDAGLTNALIVETDGNQVVVVRRTDLNLETDDKAKQLAIADNRTSEFMEWDGEILEQIALEVELNDYFTIEELSDLTGLTQVENDIEKEENTQKSVFFDAISAVKIALGDVWHLGQHRLAVVDARILVSYGILLGAEQHDVAWIVLDMFDHSKGILIACQNTGRRGDLIEIDPKKATTIIDYYDAHEKDIAARINGTD